MSDIIKTQRSLATKAMHHPAHRFDHLYRLICQQEWIWAAGQGVLVVSIQQRFAGEPAISTCPPPGG